MSSIRRKNVFQEEEEEEEQNSYDYNAIIFETEFSKKLPNTQLPKTKIEKSQYAAKVADSINKAIFADRHKDFLSSEYKGGGKSRLGQERPRDTVSVSISPDGRKLTIAANVKERKQFKNRQWQATSESKFGIHPDDKKWMVNHLNEKFPEIKTSTVRVVGPVERPRNVKENAAPHAEIQLIKDKAFSKDHVIGTSKPACGKCEEHLNPGGITHSGYEGESLSADKVKNFKKPKDTHVQEVFKIRKKVTLDHNLHGFSKTPIKSLKNSYVTPVIHAPVAPPLQGSALKRTTSVVRQHVNGNVKPNVGVSAGAGLESLINDIDREPQAHAGTMNASAGSYSTRCSKGIYARACTAEASAAVSILSASVNGPAASAGVHTGAGTWFGAHATAELARAEAAAGPVAVGVGLNAHTGVSIGLDGASVSFLGFGASVGPRMSIRTPVADVSCSIM